MKLFILTYLTLLIGICLYAQKDPNKWEADIIVRHPSGLTDTLTIGAALDGALGYQPDLDIIDTNFTTPISIRSHDSQVVQDFGTCHANMRKDIRAFSETLTFSFYVKSDTFPYDWNPDPDSNVIIIYDLTQFNFNNDNYVLENISIFSVNGYMNFFDLNSLCLFSLGNHYCSGEIANSFDDFIVLIHQTNFLMDYYQNSCDGMGNKVMKFELVVNFEIKTGIDDVAHYLPEIRNSPIENRVYINFAKAESGNIEIFDLSGRIMSLRNFSNTDLLVIPYQLSPGMYILHVNSGSNRLSHKFIVH